MHTWQLSFACVIRACCLAAKFDSLPPPLSPVPPPCARSLTRLVWCVSLRRWCWCLVFGVWYHKEQKSYTVGEMGVVVPGVYDSLISPHHTQDGDVWLYRLKADVRLCSSHPPSMLSSQCCPVFPLFLAWNRYRFHSGVEDGEETCQDAVHFYQLAVDELRLVSARVR